MCKISTETVTRANQEMMAQGKNTHAKTTVTDQGISMEISYKGKRINGEISFEEINTAYEKALRNSEKYVTCV